MKFDSSKIDTLLGKVDELPSLPSVVTELIELLNNEGSQARRVAEVIGSDQALSAKVLRVVNSSYYGLPKQIGSVSQAVVILGFSTLRSIVLGASVLETFGRGRLHQGYFSAGPFWTHAVGAAAASHAFARIAELPRPDDAFTAGLLHGVGLLVIDQHLPEVMREIQELVEIEERTLVEAEEEIMGVNHARIGGRLLEYWKLPMPIAEAVTHHVYPDACPDDRRLASCVHLGDIFCRTLGYGSAGEPSIPAVDPVALEALGISHASFPALMEPVDQDIEKATIFLDEARSAL